jgi:hypothetical protein
MRPREARHARDGGWRDDKLWEAGDIVKVLEDREAADCGGMLLN